MSVPPRHSSCPETLRIAIDVETAVLVRQPRPPRSDTRCASTGLDPLTARERIRF
jgi:hypothetical protein